MTSDIWKLENDLCRCCHSKGVFHNLAEPCKLSGEEQNYVDMLRDSLHVYISPVPGDLCVVTYKICDTCVWQLRAAVKFKKQVMESEERFKDMYNRNFIKVADFKIPPEVKMELPDYSDDEYKEDNLQIDFHEDVPVIDIKVEDTKKVKAKKPKPKPKPKSKPKKPVKKVVKPKKDKVTPKVETKTDVDDEAEDDPEAESEALADAEAEDEALAIAEAQAEAGVETENADKKGDAPAAENATKYDVVEDSKGVKSYVCIPCKRSFKAASNACQHYRVVHLHIRPNISSCPHCTARIPTQLRAAHIEKQHGIPRPSCKECGKKFSYPYQVLRHQKDIHMGEKRYSCDVCNMKFRSNGELEQHKTKHALGTPFKCKYCEKSFKWKKNMDTHIRIHLDDRRYVCQACGEAFVQYTSWKYHKSKKHPELNKKK